jgi:hypothetical protein
MIKGITTQRSARTLLIALILGIGLPALLPNPAGAYVGGGTGYPGTMGTPRSEATMVCNDWWNGICTNNVPAVTTPGRYLYESSAYAGYWQRVCVTTTFLYAPAPRSYWTVLDKATDCTSISGSATRAWHPGRNLPLEDLALTQGYFATNHKVTWNLSNGTVVGTRTYGYVHTGDYTCRTLAWPSYCGIYSNVVGTNAGLWISLY